MNLFAAPSGVDTPEPVERSAYASSASGHIVGLIATCLVYLAIVAGFLLVTYTYVAPNKPASTLAAFDIQPPASPEVPREQEKEVRQPVETQERQIEPQQMRLIEPTVVPPSPVTLPITAASPRPAEPSPREPVSPAPKTAPAPPAPQVSNNAADTWEARVLGALNRKRRYPPWALSRREQGVPYVRIVMDREGRILSTELERSSGFLELDREAVALPKRAAPLPKPPVDKPGATIELIVPIEFFIGGRR